MLIFRARTLDAEAADKIERLKMLAGRLEMRLISRWWMLKLWSFLRLLNEA
jgi:hypothetical protein